MKEIDVTWTELKAFVDERCLTCQWVEFGTFYLVHAFDGPFALSCRIHKDSGADQTAFEASYKAAGNQKLIPTDTDGIALSRTKMTQTGWHYQLYGIEFETAKLDSLVNLDVDGSALGHATIKFYNSSNVELTTQLAIDLGCVKTVIDWEPPWDYEIIGGQFRQLSVPGTDAIMHVIAVPDIPAGSGGSVPFVNNVNLRYLSNSDNIKTDGRTSKKLVYNASLHTNKLRIIIEHSILMTHKMHLMFEIFRA